MEIDIEDARRRTLFRDVVVDLKLSVRVRYPAGHMEPKDYEGREEEIRQQLGIGLVQVAARAIPWPVGYENWPGEGPFCEITSEVLRLRSGRMT